MIFRVYENKKSDYDVRCKLMQLKNKTAILVYIYHKYIFIGG